MSTSCDTKPMRSRSSAAISVVLTFLLVLTGCVNTASVPVVPTNAPAAVALAETLPATPSPSAQPTTPAAQTATATQEQPLLLDVALVPAQTLPGATIVFSYTVSTTQDQKISLGAGLGPANSSNFVSDSANDRTLDLASGTSVVTRTLVVPNDAKPGEYDAIWGLWSAGFATRYKMETRNRAVVIAAPAAATTTASTAIPADCVPLTAGPPSDPIHGDPAINITVDTQPSERKISPLIYGLADSSNKSEEQYRDLRTTLLRWGGNARSRHNWEINASNAGSDWEFRNVQQGDTVPGSAGDDFVRRNQAVGAASLLTIPTIGYVAKNGENDTRSLDVPEQGGPPIQPDSQAIAGYDPGANQRATSIRSVAAKGQPFADPPDVTDDMVYQDEWVNHLVKRFGAADAGGVQFYALDNEPDLWADNTHVDIHPTRMGYDGMLAMFDTYSRAIKAVDPSAQIVAPVLSGLTGIFYSALDRGDDGYTTAADRAAHDDMPFLPWFLDAARKHDEQAGRRYLDVVAVNNYPQGGIYPGSDDAKQDALRLRSTQQLWNPQYTDESWVRRTESPQVQLIPRLREWVDTYYPGTKTAITEWNYGNDDHINGGLAIVDVLGIFGREGLDLATYWQAPAPGTPGASAFKFYGNYDGCGHRFGDQLLTTQSTDEQTLAAYGSRDSSTGDVLIMTVNKLPNKAVQAQVALQGITTGTIQIYQFDAAQTTIHRLADAQLADSHFTYGIPPYAATLFVIKH